jgi:diadenosine tetraphosphatase ApaH/serine/threonine PP2A family protein phosphatase
MPRLAILSDIHSNLNAFNAVLEDLKARGGADAVYCLGDVIGYGPKPLECLEIARKTFGVTLKGNHEQAVVHGAKDFNDMARRAIDWTRAMIVPNFENMNELQADNWKWLAALPAKHEEEFFLFVHGAPQDPVDEYIMPMDIDPQTHTYGEKLKLAFDMTQLVTFCGHSHFPALYCNDGGFISPTYHKEVKAELDPSKKYIINVGSVGQPRDGDNRACYVTFEDGTITWRRVHYDIQDTFLSVFTNSYLDPTLGERLFRGE